MRSNLSTPLKLLAVHPSIQIQAALSCFSYGLLYLVLSSFSALFTDQYGQSIAINGLHYIAPCLGEIIGSQVGGRAMDVISRKLKRRTGSDTFDPALHLPIIVPATVLGGVGLLMYGWSAHARAPWIVVDIGALILMSAMQPVGQALQAYSMDTYPDIRASTAAAVQIFRRLGAFALPLAGPAMYKKLGYGWANVLLAGVYVFGNLGAVRFLRSRGTRLLR
jgi:MFS family permease